MSAHSVVALQCFAVAVRHVLLQKVSQLMYVVAYVRCPLYLLTVTSNIEKGTMTAHKMLFIPFSRVGVSSEPDHSVVELTDQDCFIILASDGVWEFITSKEAVDIVSQCDGAEEACRQV